MATSNPMNNLFPQANNNVMPAGGSNQWMSYPALPNFSPSTTPGGGAAPIMNATPYGTTTPPAGYSLNNDQSGGKHNLGGGTYAEPTMDPGFTNSFYGMLQQLMSGGGANLQQQLMSFLSGGSSTIPGASSLTQMANTGDPISAMPEWKAMVDAQQQNIQQNQANLKEQFAFGGDLQSSPFGTAMSNYAQQTSKDQNALLAQLDQQSMENAMQRELSASTSLTGMAGAESQFLNSLFSGAATTSPNMYQPKSSSVLGGIGSLIGGAGQGIGALEDAGMSLGFLGL